jgi:holo-[acyl-carrier protein] synthase
MSEALSAPFGRGTHEAVIVAIGTDVVEISRIEHALARHGERFERRVFTEAERAYSLRRRPSAPHFAARFAAKEAAMKALGTGWKKGVRFVDIEVERAPGGPPAIRLHGRSAEIAKAKGIGRLHLSLTHDAGLAFAFVVAEGGV